MIQLESRHVRLTQLLGISIKKIGSAVKKKASDVAGKTFDVAKDAGDALKPLGNPIDIVLNKVFGCPSRPIPHLPLPS